MLAVSGLTIAYQTPAGPREVVKNLDLQVRAGECVAVVGESGSGKSQTALAVMGLLAPNAVVSGSVSLRGESLPGLDEPALNRIRGARIGMVFQDPLTALTPHLRVGAQIAEVLRRHHRLGRNEAWREAIDWLDRVRIPDPAARARQYPHQLSGGMRQRVMIAQALAGRPEVLIADEPTTALDVTVQAEVLDLLDELKAETGAGLLLITHDMGVVARMAQRVCVMHAGRKVEEGAAAAVLSDPRSEHARALLAAVPRLTGDGRPGRARPAPVTSDAPEVLRGVGLTVRFGLPSGLFARRRELRAVDDVGFTLRAGETLGLVGESGSGKSTLARAALRLLPAQAGAVTLLGEPLSAHDRRALQKARRDLQIVFQDPLGSLNPRLSVAATVSEPLRVHRPELGAAERRRRVLDGLRDVGLSPEFAERHPHQLSGGQAQRVGIARAMILGPKLLVCDEAVSALDVSIRAQIVDLLIGLQKRSGMSMLFISHDLAVVREVSHRILVLYRGRVVEEGPADAVLQAARHPYTRALIASVLEPVAGVAVTKPPVRSADWSSAADLVEIGPGHRVAADA